ncbi:low temperature requirement protein LtrA [Crossiella equi]|uniref:Low temperature requirement protein LtrA n=1 Tax=Crossiella equi TaxID=130796 RepID=A0ABS5AJT7_9PSEU|nr:low temperature requirement protein A [Crossiella equi]MBP2476836.1 low temperature requirement protein LtrA [Crossiella equi]
MRPWYRPMVARDPAEPHRAATPLELLFDLCFVVAVAQAAAGLHHALSENHIGQGVLGFALSFYAVWWAWLNFTWFASSFDTDDLPYRLTTLLQISGGLVLAAGVPGAFHNDFTVVTIGYVVMRVAMVLQWLRAARTEPALRRCAHRFALGIALVQLGWVARLFLPESLFLPGFLLMAALELAVPVWAERAGPTTWHPEHVAERYGLFTLIVLGESVLASATAIRSGLEGEANVPLLVSVAVAGLLILFSMWWLYFDRPAHGPEGLRPALTWGYGHYLIFASAAAVGAGLSVAVDHDLHRAHLPTVAAGLAVTVPVALFVLSVWYLHLDRATGLVRWACPAVAALILGSTFSGAPVHVTAVLMAVLAGITTAARHRTATG